MARRNAAQSAATETAEQENTEMTTNTEVQDETGTAEGGHKFNEGDEATVIRGRLRTRKGTILKYNPSTDTYAVQLLDGDKALAVINAGNLKAPAESTVSVQAVVRVLAAFEDQDAALRLAAALDEVAPGTSIKLNEAHAS